jgi:hypothetical protein
MSVPSQMFVHALTPLKGWPSPTALDFTGTLSTAVTIDPLPAGRCVHVYSLAAPTYGPGSAGNHATFKTGVEDTDMAIFLLNGSDNFDVSNPGGTDWYAGEPTGTMSGLVATGAYELETTEFDTSLTYLPGDVLKAIAADTNSSATTGGGCLTNDAVVYMDSIVGVVSRGKYTNPFGKTALAFWPVYLPANPCNDTGEPCGPQA